MKSGKAGQAARAGCVAARHRTISRLVAVEPEQEATMIDCI